MLRQAENKESPFVMNNKEFFCLPCLLRNEVAGKREFLKFSAVEKKEERKGNVGATATRKKYKKVVGERNSTHREKTNFKCKNQKFEKNQKIEKKRKLKSSKNQSKLGFEDEIERMRREAEIRRKERGRENINSTLQNSPIYSSNSFKNSPHLTQGQETLLYTPPTFQPKSHKNGVKRAEDTSNYVRSLLKNNQRKMTIFNNFNEFNNNTKKMPDLIVKFNKRSIPEDNYVLNLGAESAWDVIRKKQMDMDMFLTEKKFY